MIQYWRNDRVMKLTRERKRETYYTFETVTTVFLLSSDCMYVFVMLLLFACCRDLCSTYYGITHVKLKAGRRSDQLRSRRLDGVVNFYTDCSMLDVEKLLDLVRVCAFLYDTCEATYKDVLKKPEAKK